MQNYGAVVQHVLSTQFVRPQVAAADEETAKAQLTRAAAYEINKLDPNVGLLEKTSGNNAYGLSVDGVVDRSNGDYADIATAQGVGEPIITIAAHWMQKDGTAPMTERWVQPTLALTMLQGPMERTGETPGPGPDPGPGPGPEPAPDNDEINQKLDHIMVMIDDLAKRQASDTALIMERDDYNTKKVLDEIGRVSEEFQETAKKALALFLLQNRGEGGEGGGVVP